MAEELGCDTKTIDNALQRVKRKILAHQHSREVLLEGGSIPLGIRSARS